MKSIVLGAHWLSVGFTLNNYLLLKNAMVATAKRGGKLFEIPYLLCKVAWKHVAKAAKKAGITEISLCHFWPKNADGTSVCGDPLGNEEEVARALKTIDDIIAAVKILREGDIEVRFIDGPTWGGLGWDYTNLTSAEQDSRMVSFLRQAGDKCKEANLILAVEFLRPVEDKCIGGTERMIEILTKVNHPAVKMHFDVFHSVECGEDPATWIGEAKSWIVYLHLHGNNRIAPRAKGDLQMWQPIADAIKEIDSGVDNIPAVSEPFGEATCKENPALGSGLPIPPPLPKYLDQAFKTLREVGLPIAT